MAALDFYVKYSKGNGAQIDKKMAFKDVSDQKDNSKNTFMPWQCQNIQDDEISHKVEILRTCGNKTSMCVNYRVNKTNSEQTGKYNTANDEDQLNLKSNLPDFKTIINNSKDNDNPLNASSTTHKTMNHQMLVNAPTYTAPTFTASFIDPAELSEHRKKHSGNGPVTCEDFILHLCTKVISEAIKHVHKKTRTSIRIINPKPVQQNFPTHQNNQRQNQQHHTIHQVQQPQQQVPQHTTSPKKGYTKRNSEFIHSAPIFKRIKKDTIKAD